MADQRIENVKPEESWIVGVQDGVIEFRRPMRFLKNTNRIPDIVVFALALTEVCCTGGRGKFFYNLHTKRPFGAKHDYAEVNWGSGAYAALSSLPDLIFMNVSWTEETKKEWRAMAPKDRAIELNGALMIPSEAMVMPIAVDENPYAEDNIHVDPHLARGVTILLAPHAVVGYTAEIFKGLSMSKDHRGRPWLSMKRTKKWYERVSGVFCPTAEELVKQIMIKYQENLDGIRMKMNDVDMQTVKACMVLKQQQAKP